MLIVAFYLKRWLRRARMSGGSLMVMRSSAQSSRWWAHRPYDSCGAALTFERQQR
jgi:hypothetical protein